MKTDCVLFGKWAKRIQSLCFFSILIVSALVNTQTYATDFLTPEKAFQVQAGLIGDSVRVNIQPAKGYYVYRDSIKLSLGLNSGNLKEISQLELPIPKRKFDENFQKIVETYTHYIEFSVPIKNISDGAPLLLEISLQGCAEQGICYPPMTRYVSLSEYGVFKNTTEELPKANLDSSRDDAVNSNIFVVKDDLSGLQRILETASLPVLLGLFFLLGIGLAFTPCMLPMLPILSSIVFGTTHHHLLSRKRTILLAVMYIMGMAIAFSLAGMATAWFGSGIQAYLQNKWVLIGFAGMMIVLAGSLLGFYEFHLPQFWHAHVDKFIGKQKGGSPIGALMLGALSSLVASPCVTAPLAGVLTFIAQSGQVGLGGLILFVMAWGMGFPLFLFSLGASRVVPRVGPWMSRVQKFFGVLLLILAIWIMWPVISALSTKVQLTSLNERAVGTLTFKVARSEQELDLDLKQAREKGRPVLIDVYANWCVSCRELEALTLSNPKVVSKLEGYSLIEVDVTEGNESQRKLLKRFNIFGPPAIILVNEDGAEKANGKYVGYISAEKLLEHL